MNMSYNAQIALTGLCGCVCYVFVCSCYSTFNGVNELNPAQRVPILEDTIVRLDGKDGRFIESFGSNL